MNPAIYQAIIQGDPAINVTMTASDLRGAIAEIVRQERDRIKEAVKASRELPTMTRKQAAEALNVHVNTLNRWAADGYLKPVKYGTKVLYRASDIESMLTRRQNP